MFTAKSPQVVPGGVGPRPGPGSHDAVSAKSLTVLPAGEYVSAIEIPGRSAGGVQWFEKVMQRAAWDFALVSVAAVKRTDGEVRLVLGGVAPKPWRVSESVEEDVSVGGLTEDDIATLAERAMYDARPLAKNGYKVEMAAAVLRRGIAAIVA